MTRNKTLGRCGVALLSVAAAISLAGCSNPVSALQQTFGTPSVAEARAKQAAAVSPQLSAPTIIKNGTLTVGLDTSASVPRCLTSRDGSMQGYDIDMACAVADELGLQVEFVSVSNASQALGQTCDVVMGASASSTGGVTVVGAYAEDAVGFFHKGSEQVAAKEDLVGKTIGVQSGTTGDAYCTDDYGQDHVKQFSSGALAVAALVNGQVDCVVIDNEPAKNFVAANTGLKILGTEYVTENYAAAIAKTNTDLLDKVNGAIAELKADGTIDGIIAKYIKAE